MAAKLRVGVNNIHLTGRGAKFARTALGLVDNGQHLTVRNVVPLEIQIEPWLAEALERMFGSLTKERRVSVTELPPGALLDVHTTNGNGGNQYSHTEANPLWWKPSRIFLAWITGELGDFIDSDDPKDTRISQWLRGEASK